MSGTYRVAIHWRAEEFPRQASAKDAHWSLAAVDPIARVMVGTLRASDGVAIPYRLWRSRAEPRGLVVLLHGAFDYSGAFDEIGPIFAARGFTALAFDQRGFGGSWSRGKWCGAKRMLCDVTDVVRYMRARFGEALPLFLLGESMGAAIGLQAVAGNSELNVQGLVMAAPGSVAGLFRRFLVGSLLRAATWFAPHGETRV
jgi:alpha-beta hydrolase superfamily lysophospholipase